MDYFTVEIAGRAVASFRSENHQEATHFFEAEDFRDDLTVLESEGKPLWDRKAALSLRKATTEEASEVEHAYEFDDDPERTIEDEFVVFLVPVADLTAGEDDTVED
ncbi:MULTISPECIES: hypothetical protein [Rhizobium]|uniref:hypothetical protein n=1 Tax=Rhizobium TaxID=379 RepID=UPI00103C83E1|nr:MULTISPECIES: hypothetical protein [Rhizobium]MBY3185830.1 hypothetical protein [Rhizobium laguerreae]MBY3238793.1 hypothetical protein [Rhizobium laguerreae]MBY3382123.1 hypothetical protein [Rhizobium laguerreae]MBY5820215.1 hypothetical protein [Rhizobium leguminosarum]NKL01379.1 hypothetical protein [Rhizobium leguminosarum bv. viciae]